MRQVKFDQLKAVAGRFGDAVVNPAVWPDIMEDICKAVGASGAAMLQSNNRTPDVPRTASVDEPIRQYFRDAWHTRDPRAGRAVPMMLRGQTFVADQDLITREEMRRDPFYNELVGPMSIKWFGGIAVWSGSTLWGLCMYRTAQEGFFDDDVKRVHGLLSQRLSETATLSKAVGRQVIAGMTRALHLVEQPALAVDRQGFVLDVNSGALQLFDDSLRVRSRKLVVKDKTAQSELANLFDQLRVTADTTAISISPIVVKRQHKLPIVVRVLPIDGAARCPFFGARALLTLTDLSMSRRLLPRVLSRVFGFTPAECRLAEIIVRGASPEIAANELGISRETARNQIKAMFGKTGTHRQSELVSLLMRL